MEAASENTTPKRPRGRPRRFDATMIAHVRNMAPEVGPRQHMNVGYRQWALRHLLNDPQFHWLCNREEMLAGARDSWRQGLLSELGRIDDPDDMRAIAAQICTLKPKVKQGIALIRRWRLNRPKRDPLRLLSALSRTIDDHMETYPDTSLDDIADTLEALMQTVGDQHAHEEEHPV